ncbi:MAG: hypothetical protein WC477_02695 [Patescibacteria group bacterium]
MSTISFVHHLVKSMADLICGHIEDESDREAPLIGRDVRRIYLPVRSSIRHHIVCERYPSNEREVVAEANVTANNQLS